MFVRYSHKHNFFFFEPFGALPRAVQHRRRVGLRIAVAPMLDLVFASMYTMNLLVSNPNKQAIVLVRSGTSLSRT